MAANEGNILGDKNKKLIFSILGLIVILLISIIIASIFLISTFRNGTDTNIDEDGQSLNSVSISDIQLISLSSAVNTNLLPGEDGRNRVISFNVSIGVNNTTSQSENIISLISSSEPVVRDIILSVLREKTYDELNQVGAVDLLKEELIINLQNEFQTYLIVQLYLSDLYIY